jgi:hypothetical protein
MGKVTPEHNSIFYSQRIPKYNMHFTNIHTLMIFSIFKVKKHDMKQRSVSNVPSVLNAYTGVSEK